MRQRVAVLGDDRVLRWLDPADGALETGPTVPDRFSGHSPQALEKGFHQLAFSPDGRHFLCGDGDVLIIAETDSGMTVSATASEIGAIAHRAGVPLSLLRPERAGLEDVFLELVGTGEGVGA